MKRTLSLLLSLARAHWQAHAAYRLGAVIWIVNGFITPIILMSIWLLIRQHQQLSLSEGQIITYYLMMVVMTRLTQSWSAERLSRDIKEGSFSQVLIRPLSFSLPYIGKDMAMRLVRLVTLFPFFMIALVWFRHSIYLTPSWSLWLWGLVAIILGYFINLFMELIMGLSSLWTEEGYGLIQLMYLLSYMFSGSLMPLELLPSFWQRVALLLPFRYLIGFPIDLLMGRLSMIDIQSGFVFMSAWLAVLFVLYTAIFRSGVKKYSAIGS